MSNNNKMTTSGWGWFSVFDPTNNTEPEPITTDKITDEINQIRVTAPSATGTEVGFEVLDTDNLSLKSYTASCDHSSVLFNGDIINDQYVNLNQYGTITPTQSVKKHNDDDKKENNNNQNSDYSNDAVVVSEIASSCNVESLCQSIANKHIIDSQEKQILRLENDNRTLLSSLNDKDKELKQCKEQISALERERDNLQKKLNEINGNFRVSVDSNAHSATNAMSNSAVLVSNKYIIYGCIQCEQHLFDSSAMIQRQIEIDGDTFGVIVDCLFNNHDTTMGPTVCKTMINGMFKVKEVFCDGCLGSLGWKIVESFDEWTHRFNNKYCIDISSIKKVVDNNQ